jgi:ribonuclease G
MLKELVINAAPHETRIALLENSTVAEVFIERQDEASIVGNIYKGRVQRVLPGMQAAFVDIGCDQAAFIYVSDVQDAFINDNPYQYFKRNNDELSDAQAVENAQAPVQAPVQAQTQAQNDESLNMGGRRSAPDREAVIEEILTEGQELIVQVSKAAIGNKGPRLTTHISIAGRYMVLIPVSGHIGISRLINNDKERARLKDLLLSLKKNKFGYILRTQAEGINAEIMKKEMDFLNGTWNSVLAKSQTVSAPFLFYKELNVTFKAVRDLLTNDADKLIIDSAQEHANIRQFCKELMPDMNLSVELYEGRESIFDAYNIEADLTRALSGKVWLKSGGYIVIEQTEALVAIDVNTGKYVGKYNFDETILKTNLEAVKEIAYQIRLRNLGGIIIIDFIDMKKKQHRERVMAQLNEAMKKDKSQIKILPLTELGLVQMTRKRVRHSLSRTLCEPCFYCNGSAYLLSGKSICHKIYRDLMSEAADMMGNRFTVKVHPDIAQLLHGTEKHLISDLEQRFSKPIAIYPEAHYHIEEYHIFEKSGYRFSDN